MILFWGVLMVAAVAAVRYLSRGRHMGSPAEPPASQAAGGPSRYSPNGPRGEIDADEYRQRLDILR